MFGAPPPPRETAQKWAAFGVVVLVAVGASVGASKFKKHYEPPPPVDPPPYIPPESTATPEPSDDPGDDTADEPDEPPPGEPGTPKASLSARPAWGKLDIGVRGPPTQQYAPQPSQPLDVFLRAHPLTTEIERGFVICRMQTYGKADTFAGDDLHVRATFGTAPIVASDGAEDANLGFVSAPLVTLKKNDAVSFEVYDRDVFELTPITKPTVKFFGAGSGLSSTDSGASIECRALSGDSLQSAINLELGKSDALVNKLGKRRLDQTSPSWGWPAADIVLTERATGDAAALNGWDDYRVRSRVSKIAEQVKRLEEEKPATFMRLLAGAGDQATLRTATVKFSGLECKGARCVVKLHVKNTSDMAWHWGAYDTPTAYVATEKSAGPIPAMLERPDQQSTAVEPGAEVDLRLVATAAKLDLSKDPAIVGVCLDDRCVALRVTR